MRRRSKRRLADLVRELAAAGRSVAIATHDVEFVARAADRVVVLADGDVVADGPTAEVVVGSPAFAPQVAKVLAPEPGVTGRQRRGSPSTRSPRRCGGGREGGKGQCPYAAVLALASIAGLAMFAWPLFATPPSAAAGHTADAPLVFVLVLPVLAGLWTAPSAVGVIAGSTLAPRLARRIDPARIIGVGLAVSAAGYLVLTQLPVGDTGLAVAVSGAVVVSAGLGPMMALATDMVVGAAPPERAGAAAAIATTTPQLGGALGIAALGSVILAVSRYQSGGEPGASAPEAFTAGLRLAAGLSAVLMAVAAVTVVALLGRALRPTRTRPLSRTQSGG